MAKHRHKSDDEELNESSIYEESGRQDLVEDDEMSPSEEGFMKGYEEAEEKIDEVDAEEEPEEF
ncbi:MAG: hypothetical protein KKC75_05660 [Nanoarchaeota archaeon]|nr:hypothetical protein [Nanoarchaeota archaeon]MBU1004938.1 hypothetical protein [Nanoarchaeota archaeon]MBU1945616.1 hypothetical protein [Nanoarchaeota archaeon]